MPGISKVDPMLSPGITDSGNLSVGPGVTQLNRVLTFDFTQKDEGTATANRGCSPRTHRIFIRNPKKNTLYLINRHLTSQTNYITQLPPFLSTSTCQKTKTHRFRLKHRLCLLDIWRQGALFSRSLPAGVSTNNHICISTLRSSSGPTPKL